MRNKLILVINGGVSKGRSLVSSVVASVPSIALRPLRCLRCVGWKLRLIHSQSQYSTGWLEESKTFVLSSR